MYGDASDETPGSVESSSALSQSDSSPESQSGIEIPSISLPKGGGAIRGIGEKFAANPVTGTGSMSIPIATSPGRGNFGPQLSLSYDSGSGNGLFGFGWSLSLPSITRKTDKGLPKYQDENESDVFLLSGSEDLVPVYRQDIDGSWISRHPDYQRDIEGFWIRDEKNNLVIHEDKINDYRVRLYRPRIEGLFARIERWTHDDGDVHWRSISKDNILTIYGKDSYSRIFNPNNPSQIFSWLICETRDDEGNAIIYEYKEDDGSGVDLSQVHERNRGALDSIANPGRATNRYIKRIKYGNQRTLLKDGKRLTFLEGSQYADTKWMFEVVFDYGEHDKIFPTPEEQTQWTFRNDSFSSYRSGFEIRTTRLCQRVLMFHHVPEDNSPNSFNEPLHTGYDGLVRATDFTYSEDNNKTYTFIKKVTQIGYKQSGTELLSRSLPPVEFEYSPVEVQDQVEEINPESLENLPIGVDGASYQWQDIHGEGIPGILTEQGNQWFYKNNLSPITETREDGNIHVDAKFSATEVVKNKPNLSLSGGAQFMDLAGDGQPDLVVLDNPGAGFYEHDQKESWKSFKPLTSIVNRNLSDPNLKFIDLDGDGHADLCISEDDAFIWHASQAEAGFGPAQRVVKALNEENGPNIIFADREQSIYLADMSGDGLSDILRIRNGEVCYWPNLGYARFGAKITLDNSPNFDQPDQFSQNRIRLADIDGSGTVDIIYLHRDGVRLYFNQSGNSLSEPTTLDVSPRVSDLVNITATDLLGNTMKRHSDSTSFVPHAPLIILRFLNTIQMAATIVFCNNSITPMMRWVTLCKLMMKPMSRYFSQISASIPRITMPMTRYTG